MACEGPLTGDMPREIQRVIASLLPCEDLAALGRTCKTFAGITNARYTGLLALPHYVRIALRRIQYFKSRYLFNMLTAARLLCNIDVEGRHMRLTIDNEYCGMGVTRLTMRVSIHGNANFKALLFQCAYSAFETCTILHHPEPEEVNDYKKQLAEAYAKGCIAASLRRKQRAEPGVADLMKAYKTESKNMRSAMSIFHYIAREMHRNDTPNVRIRRAQACMEYLQTIIHTQEKVASLKRALGDKEEQTREAAKKRRFE